MRRHLVWASTAPLMVAGLFAGHSLGFRLAAPEAHERADALGQSGHAYLDLAPLALAVCLGLLLAALLFRAVAGFRDEPRRPAPSRSLIVLPPLAFVVQEHLERLLYSGEVPWTVGLEPSFLFGLALQLPFALAALLIAWLLDSVAHVVGRALAASAPSVRFPLVPIPVRATGAPRVVGLARGYGERAPPHLRRP
jgi:hypothetical protein